MEGADHRKFGIPFSYFERKQLWRTVDRMHIERRGIIDMRTPISGIGSCFAQNVLTLLLNIGFNIIKIPHQAEHQHTFQTVYTMVKLLAEPRPFDKLLHEDGGRYFYLPFMHCDGDSAGEVKAKVEQHLNYKDCIAKSEILFLTLGGIEGWWDNELELYVTVPLKTLLESGRYKSSVMDADEVEQCLREIITICRKFNPNLKLIFTVSPQPGNVTFRDKDIYEATLLSKTTLRAAISQVENGQNVLYFPSLEYAFFNRNGAFWQSNGRRVSIEGYTQVAQLFIKHFGVDELQDDELGPDHQAAIKELTEALESLGVAENWPELQRTFDILQKIFDGCSKPTLEQQALYDYWQAVYHREILEYRQAHHHYTKIPEGTQCYERARREANVLTEETWEAFEITKSQLVSLEQAAEDAMALADAGALNEGRRMLDVILGRLETGKFRHRGALLQKKIEAYLDAHIEPWISVRGNSLR